MKKLIIQSFILCIWLQACAPKKPETSNDPEKVSSRDSTIRNENTFAGTSTKPGKPMIGLVYRDHKDVPELAGLHDYIGQLVPDSAGEYNYALSLFTKDDYYLLLFEKLVPSGREGFSNFLVLDTLSVTVFDTNVFVQAGNCTWNRKDDESIIAIVKIRNNLASVYKNVLDAWKANTLTEKLEKVDKRSVTCLCEGCYCGEGGEYDE